MRDNEDVDTIKLPKNNSSHIVKQALSFQKPDRLPVFDGFWSEFEHRWRKASGLPDDADIYDHYWTDLRVPVALEQLFPTRKGEVRREGEYIFFDDGWGRIVRTKEGASFSEPVERLLKQRSDLDKIEFEPAGLNMRYSSFCRQVEYHRNKGRAVFVKIGGPFIRSSFFRGETDFLMDLAGDEQFAKAVVEKVGEHLLMIGLESLKRTEAYDFGVWIYDDMCNISTPMFSPATFERVFMPVYERIISALKAAGARWVILHCDGNLFPLLDMLIETGIDGINPVEPAAGLDVVSLMDRYYGRISFIGGVCNTHILPGNDPAVIRRHVESIVDAGKNGGLIIGTHSVGPDITQVSYELYRKIVADRGAYGKIV
jgi:uroporphyrinogen decarboxylase